MNRKQTTFLFILCLCVSLTAAAWAGAPTSQFGFKGWPYRQQTPCQPAKDANEESCPSAQEPSVSPITPCPTERPTQAPATPPAPTAAPSQTDDGCWQEEPTQAPTATPPKTAEPTQAPTKAPDPTRAPVVTEAPTATPVITKAPEKTEKPTIPTPSPSTDEDYTTGSVTAQEENAFLLVNADRAANGRAALTLDSALCALARLKSNDMNQNHYFAHTSPTLGSAAEMLRSHGYAFNAVGENIAHHATVDKAQAAFMSSTGHRTNILGAQWTKVGIGVSVDSQGFVYVTQLFVR